MVLLERMLVLLMRLTTLLTHSLLLLNRVLMLTLTVLRRNPLTSSGEGRWLEIIALVPVLVSVWLMHPASRPLLQMTLTLWLLSMQSGCMSIGHLTWRVVLTVLLRSRVALQCGVPTLVPPSILLNSL